MASNSVVFGYRHDGLRIGAHLSTAGTPRYNLNGAIDDVRIYNRALSDDEITALANASPVDETLQYFLSKSSLVVEGKITRVQKPIANAQKQLIGFGAMARPAVSQVAINGSFEAKARAQAILESPAIAHNESALVALMRVIALRPPKDCVPLLVGILPHCVNRSLETTAREVLADVAMADDLPYLKRILDESGPQTQCIVVCIVAQLLGTARASEIYEMLQSKNAEVRFAAARALLDLGDRKCLSALIDLLDSNDLCGRAAATLRIATRKSFGFDEELTPERRREAIAAWQKWLVKNGEHADLRFPIQLPDETVTSGLVLHYTFSCNGEQIQDRSGNQYHGIIHGAPKRVDGIIGKALSLDGKLDYIDTGLKYSDSLKSFCMWIKSDFKSDRAVIPFGVQDPVDQRFYFGFDKGGDLGLGLGTSMFANEASRNLSNLDTTWHHYALTWNGSRLNLYIDGVLCATKTGSANPTGNYFVGQLNRPKLPEDFSVDGIIEDVRFYDRILSENEISTLFQLGDKRTD